MSYPEVSVCPWCRSDSAVLRKTENDGLYYVECQSCHARGPETTFRAAADMWNFGSRLFEVYAYGERDVYEPSDEIAPSTAGRGDGRHGPQARHEPTETVDSPAWYTAGGVETIDKVEAVVDGLPAKEAYLLGQVVRYVDRAGMKDEAAVDLGKANNYAHRLVRGKWRDR